MQLAAASKYPTIWGILETTTIGTATKAINANCGFGYAGTYIDPAGDSCTGYFAVKDSKCDFGCNTRKALYYAASSYFGAQILTSRILANKSEYLLNYPDTTMATGTVYNGITL